MPCFKTFATAAVFLALAGTACAPAMEVDTAPQPVQAINVINELPDAMIVWFDDGTGERLLGTVAAGSQDRFVLAGTDATTVSVVARDEAQTRTIRRTVTLRPGGVADVRLN